MEGAGPSGRTRFASEKAATGSKLMTNMELMQAISSQSYDGNTQSPARALAQMGLTHADSGEIELVRRAASLEGDRPSGSQRQDRASAGRGQLARQDTPPPRVPLIKFRQDVMDRPSTASPSTGDKVRQAGRACWTGPSGPGTPPPPSRCCSHLPHPPPIAYPPTTSA